MASKPSPDSLIHCAVCGEDYSATYRRCPFCGAKNGPPPASAPAGRGRGDEDDGYVFDGQDLFDDEPEDDYRLAVRPKGGKRLAEKPGGRFDLSAAPINWPRLITFLCSLIIIIAALIIVFTVIYPQLRGPKEPPAADSNPPTTPHEPGAPPAQPRAPPRPNPAHNPPRRFQPALLPQRTGGAPVPARRAHRSHPGEQRPRGPAQPAGGAQHGHSCQHYAEPERLHHAARVAGQCL